MWEPVIPIHRHPVFTRINAPYRLKKLVVDRVDAEDGQYDVLHLGTGMLESGQQKRKVFNEWDLLYK